MKMMIKHWSDRKILIVASAAVIVGIGMPAAAVASAISSDAPAVTPSASASATPAPSPTLAPTDLPVPPPTVAPTIAPDPVHVDPTTDAPVPADTPTEQNDSSTVTPGAYCSDEGATGVTKKGKTEVCKATATDKRLRWRSA